MPDSGGDADGGDAAAKYRPALAAQRRYVEVYARMLESGRVMAELMGTDDEVKLADVQRTRAKTDAKEIYISLQIYVIVLFLIDYTF